MGFINKSNNVRYHINKLKNKNQLIISTEQRKLLKKLNTHLFKKKRKNYPESGHRGKLHQHNKDHTWQTHSKHHSQQWNIESITSKIRNNARISTLNTFIQYSYGSHNHDNKWSKKKRKENEYKLKKKRRLSLSADEMILYIKNPKDATRKPLVAVQLLSRVWLFVTPWIAAH